MKLIVCLDERKGMQFNNKRQSRDRILIDDLVRHVDGASLYIAPYSELLFNKHCGAYVLTDNPCLAAKDGDFAFVENIDPSPFLDKITAVIIYHWNRHYPSDVTFSMDMSAFHLVDTTEFAGSSHEKITKEVWVK